MRLQLVFRPRSHVKQLVQEGFNGGSIFGVVRPSCEVLAILFRCLRRIGQERHHSMQYCRPLSRSRVNECNEANIEELAEAFGRNGQFVDGPEDECAEMVEYDRLQVWIDEKLFANECCECADRDGVGPVF